MARHEADREDLMREAVALPERVELRIPHHDEPVTIGFRANSAMSLFIGQDPVYQFDPSGRLRRAFVNGLLYRSQHNTLARLQRVRTANETLLVREDLSPADLACFRAAMMTTVRAISDAVRDRSVSVLRIFPADAQLLPKIEQTFETITAVENWLSPEIRRRLQ